MAKSENWNIFLLILLVVVVLFVFGRCTLSCKSGERYQGKKQRSYYTSDYSYGYDFPNYTPPPGYSACPWGLFIYLYSDGQSYTDNSKAQGDVNAIGGYMAHPDCLKYAPLGTDDWNPNYPLDSRSLLTSPFAGAYQSQSFNGTGFDTTRDPYTGFWFVAPANARFNVPSDITIVEMAQNGVVSICSDSDSSKCGYVGYGISGCGHSLGNLPAASAFNRC